MKNKTQILLILFVSILIFSCEGEKEVYLGKVQIEGIDDVTFDIFQRREFDSVTPINYQIVKEKEFITAKKFLLGTFTYETDTKNFRARSVDSIVYLTFYSTHEICAVFDLKTEKGYPHLETDGIENFELADSLLRKLQKKNSQLTGNWKK